MKADSTKMEDVASTPIEQQTGKDKGGPLGALRQVGRIASFWRRGGVVYLAYKGAQVPKLFSAVAALYCKRSPAHFKLNATDQGSSEEKTRVGNGEAPDRVLDATSSVGGRAILFAGCGFAWLLLKGKAVCCEHRSMQGCSSEVPRGCILYSVLQIGQFFAARAEFVPEPICKKLALLHDQASRILPEPWQREGSQSRH